MGCIDYQPDVMRQAKLLHRRYIHRPVDTLAMMHRDVLLTRLGAVVIGITRLFQHLHGLAPFSRSSKYQYHLIIFVQR